MDENFWSNFEAQLGTFDSDAVIDYAERFLVSYGADDWSDADHHNFEYEIEQIVEGLSTRLRSRFADWVRTLPMPAAGSFNPVQSIDANARFLSFNYTPTLQRLYGVPEPSVIHIHGQSLNIESSIVIGHAWEPGADEQLASQIDEETDVRVAGGYRLIDSYFSDTFKPTWSIIEQNSPFFTSLSDVNEIIVMGHSLSHVDAPYFEEVLKRVDRHHARWTISYHNDSSKERHNFNAFHVAPDLVRFVPLKLL
ncbi:hypothetical protein J2W42_002742 [Rhizobium tibeticum]|nr:hypothetical protein [Rhizobium tibeticum]